MTDLTLYAQPEPALAEAGDISATGFYFETAQQYEERAAKTVNDFGGPVEEFEIQFIDGSAIDCALARAWDLCQVNFEEYLEAAADWEDNRKRYYIIAVGECGLGHFDVADDPDHDGVEILSYSSLRDYAEDLVADGVFGEVPKALRNHIDYESIATDLSFDYSTTSVAGEEVIYACR